MNSFKPMLAYKLEESQLKSLKFPFLTQPKIDGIRCVILKGEVLSRTLKPIPNLYIRQKLKENWCVLNKPYIIDGELTYGDNFQTTTSAIMSEKGEPDFRYFIFDGAISQLDLLKPYPIRMSHLIGSLETKNILSIEDLMQQEQYFLEQGHEGIILRNALAPYKFGRSTFKEGALMKFKRFEDSEAVIIGMEPQYRNDNEAETDNLGHTKRSSHKDNMTPLNTLGAFKCIGINGEFKDCEFKIGSGKGLTKMKRKEIWENRYKYDRKVIKYQYQKIGSKDKPRILTFIGFRED